MGSAMALAMIDLRADCAAFPACFPGAGASRAGLMELIVTNGAPVAGRQIPLQPEPEIGAL